ncbi:MAG: ATP-dependent zinc metalloprotease FtsH [Bacteriovoracaceae bacterium]|nr:ATP-dependent zinc metalloprotease FtsH [Bacteriovoracaceae bacterium]
MNEENNQSKKNKPKEKKSSSKGKPGLPKGKDLSLWLLVFFGALFMANYFQQQNVDKRTKEVPYSEVIKAIRNGQVKRVTFKGEILEATLSEQGAQDVKGNISLVTPLPPLPSPDLLSLLESKGIEIVATAEKSDTWMNILISFLPWIFIIGFFYYSSKSLNKKMGGQGLPPFMGGHKSHQIDASQSKIKFSDVAGAQNAKTDLQEVVDFLKTPDKFKEMGAELPRGVLMVGPPGTGKTLMAKAVAGEAEVPFFSMSGSEFIELYVGMGASRVRKLFEEAKEKAPSIIFIDEIDSIGRARGTGLGGGHDEREQTLNQILAEMDGFGTGESVVVLAATNRPDVLDTALTRPGRFDRQVVMDLPMIKAREEIIKIHMRKIPTGEDVDINHIARITPGFSGAQLKNLVNEAALIAARKGDKLVSAIDFSLARDKVLMGNPRDEVLTEKQKRVIAIHESGHALVAILSKNSNPITKITIIPRGRALGFTEQTPEEDMVNQSKGYLMTQLAILLGGRVAEEILLEEITTGAQDDLKRATNIARSMIANFGMSDTFGLLTVEMGEEHAFLGREMSRPKNFSEETAQKLDKEISLLLEERKSHVKILLEENRPLLERLSQELFEKETLEKQDIYQIIGF